MNQPLDLFRVLPVVLLWATAVGLIYVPILILNADDIETADLAALLIFLPVCGLVTLHAVVLAAWIILAPIIGLVNLFRSSGKRETLPALTRVSAPLALALAGRLRWRNRMEITRYSPAEHAFAGYQAVRALWWTFFAQFPLFWVTALVWAIVWDARSDVPDSIFPAVLVVLFFFPPLLLLALTVPCMLFKRTYSNSVGDTDVIEIQGTAQSDGALRVKLTPYFGVIAWGCLEVPLFAWFLSAALSESA